MSSETRRYIEELLALSPWIAFVIAVAWFWGARGARQRSRLARVRARASATTREATRPQADHDYVTAVDVGRRRASRGCSPY